MLKTNPHVTALSLARNLIANRTERYICVALQETANSYAALSPAAIEIIRLIESRLGSRNTLEGWLICHGHATQDEIFKDYGGKLRILNTRLDWIDSLIKEYS